MSISLISKKLKEIDAANKELENNDATTRTRVNMLATLQKKFQVTIRDFQEAQTNAKMSMEERLVREIRVVKPNVTADEVARIMEQDDPSRIFQQETLGDLDQQRAKQNLLFITERHRDILTLEKSIRELHQLFVDMAALVMQQGELVDQIERSVSMSVEHTAAANVELDSAIRAMSCNRRVRSSFPWRAFSSSHAHCSPLEKSHSGAPHSRHSCHHHHSNRHYPVAKQLMARSL